MGFAFAVLNFLEVADSFALLTVTDSVGEDASESSGLPLRFDMVREVASLVDTSYIRAYQQLISSIAGIIQEELDLKQTYRMRQWRLANQDHRAVLQSQAVETSSQEGRILNREGVNLY